MQILVLRLDDSTGAFRKEKRYIIVFWFWFWLRKISLRITFDF